ncbi:MAG: nucleotide exchange factor GrpE [Porphyromonas sp.]
MSEEIKDPQLVDETKLPEEETNCQSSTSPKAEGEELADTTPNALSPEEQLQSELDKLKDTHLRLVAEYDNYRKRTLKEKSELIRSGGEKVLTELLPVVDDLDIALQNLDKATDLDALKEGMHLIYAKFADFLSRQGVTPITTEEAPFDEELHEAIATFPAPSEELKGKIIDCVKKGYKLHDKVLRHASVVVGQ